MTNDPRGKGRMPQNGDPQNIRRVDVSSGRISRPNAERCEYEHDDDNAIAVKPVKLKDSSKSSLKNSSPTGGNSTLRSPSRHTGGTNAPYSRMTAQQNVRSASPRGASGAQRAPESRKDVFSRNFAVTDNTDNAVPIGRRANKNKAIGVKESGLTVGRIVRRSLLVFATLILFTVGSVFAFCFTIAYGPSEDMRDRLVMTALQASATKWVPDLFLDPELVDQIWENSQKVTIDSIPAGDYGPDNGGQIDEDEWENAVDGMIYETISGPTYKGYVLLVRDPSRLYVATSCDFSASDRYGMRIFDIAERDNAIAVINAGEYVDNGFSLGDTPIGLTYSNGEMVWNDYYERTFIGFDSNNRLVVTNKMTSEEADRLGIRDAVSFQQGNLLIDTVDGNVRLHYTENNTGAAQRTAIGQRADGTVILVVTDGRTASSPGATRNNIIDVMVSYGAVTAGMLDGGSSSMMYYRDYYDKYDIDKSKLDQWQLKGIVNSYKAFTNPRTMPTFFAVKP